MILSSNGNFVDPEDLPQSLSYTDGRLTQIEVTAGSWVYRKTLTYTGELLTGVSDWVRQ